MSMSRSMASNVFFGASHLNGNLMVAIDTATISDGGELVELCVLPLDRMLDVHKELHLFDLRMKPNFPENIDFDYCPLSKHELAEAILKAYPSDKVTELFEDWFDGLGLKDGRKILPVAYNWAEKRQTLIEWMGRETFNKIFHDGSTDIEMIARFCNDRLSVRAEDPVFKFTNIAYLAQTMRVERLERHTPSPLSNCYTIAQVYKRLTQIF